MSKETYRRRGMVSGAAGVALALCLVGGGLAHSATAKENNGTGGGHDEVVVCHLTGNGKFVEITVDDDATYGGHGGHEGDLIGVVGGCPTGGEQPEAEEPVAEGPVVEEPVVEEPATEERAVEEPVTEEPEAGEPVSEGPVVEPPGDGGVSLPGTGEQPATEEPVVQEPVTEEPVVEEPVVEIPGENPIPVDEETDAPTIPEEIAGIEDDRKRPKPDAADKGDRNPVIEEIAGVQAAAGTSVLPDTGAGQGSGLLLAGFGMVLGGMALMAGRRRRTAGSHRA